MSQPPPPHLADSIEVDGRRLEIAWHGPGPDEAPTLVFLHHGLGCTASWRDFPARLAAAMGYGGLVYSRLGYGGSDPCPLPRPLTFLEREGPEELDAVLRATGVRSAALYGHSDGGSIALAYAAQRRFHGLRAVVTEAAHVFCEEITREAIRRTGEEYAEGGLRRALELYHGRNTEGAFRGWHDAWLDPGFADWSMVEELRRIEVPVLALQGEEDPYGSPAQLERIVHSVRSVSGRAESRVLAQCGHDPHRERPEEVLGAVTRFLEARI